MRPLAVVELEVLRQADDQLTEVRIAPEIDVLVLHCPPETFDEDVVERATPTVHADGHALALQDARERVGRELGTLVAVEDLRTAVEPQGFLERIDTEAGVHRVADPPTQHLAAVPVQDRDQVGEAPSQPDVGDVAAPHLIGPGDRNAPEQVGIDLVLRARPTGVRTRSDRDQPHPAHQPLDALTVHLMAPVVQLDHHAPGPVERSPGVDLVDQAAD